MLPSKLGDGLSNWLVFYHTKGNGALSFLCYKVVSSEIDNSLRKKGDID